MDVRRNYDNSFRQTSYQIYNEYSCWHKKYNSFKPCHSLYFICRIRSSHMKSITRWLNYTLEHQNHLDFFVNLNYQNKSLTLWCICISINSMVVDCTRSCADLPKSGLFSSMQCRTSSGKIYKILKNNQLIDHTEQ